MSWTFGHPRDYFIAGIIVGVMFSAWVAGMVALFIQTRRRGAIWQDERWDGKSSSRIGNRRQQHRRPQEGPNT